MLKTKLMRKVFLFFFTAAIFGCKKDSLDNDPITYGNSFVLSIDLDKASYTPGETVQFSLNKTIQENITVRYKHLNDVIQQHSLSGNQWTWTTPSSDFKGYMVDLYMQKNNGEDSIITSVGVDVSSDWSKFPRYGFLTDYGNLTHQQMDNILSKLTRYHINGIQFYDWQYKHHWPMGGTGSQPMASWTDISNKPVYFNTLKYYIDEGHKRNIRSMFYNLAFGALEDAQSDGVQKEWFLYKDQNHQNIDQHTLPKPFFKSNILVANASNTQWQEYIAQKNSEVYANLNFDGYHVDALGDRGSLYDWNGNWIHQQQSYYNFLTAMKTAHPNKKLVMNAVNQFGQIDYILNAPIEFPYTEVWGPNDTYDHLRNIIQSNFNASNGKSTVLAAYMNYDKSQSQGYFNTHSVLLTDAVIFAFGGAHLELGEHMLGNEYFPNNNLKMQDDLSLAITKYYDFFVAYENLLRDGGTFDNTAITAHGAMSIETWPASAGKVASISKKVNNKQVFHLINFTNATNLNWRDANGTRQAPTTFNEVQLSFQTNSTVNKIWFASPDYKNGVAQNINFTKNGNTITFNIPSLKYWNMIVVE